MTVVLKNNRIGCKKNNLRAEASDIDEAWIELGALGAKTPEFLAFEFLNTGNLIFAL